MKIEQSLWKRGTGWLPRPSGGMRDTVQLALFFGASEALREARLIDDIRRFYPNAHLMGCTTAGEICGTQVCDGSLALTGVAFEHSVVKWARVSLTEAGSSLAAGEQLASQLDKEGLIHAFVLSDGLVVNGTELTEGLTRSLPETITVTGGLAGDGDRFETTMVSCGGTPETGTVAILGLYGERLKVGVGSMGGWDPFGPERLITRSEGNVLRELDGKSALDLYKKYLGDLARGLPASGLRFPLSVRTAEREAGVIRTILAINETEKSMTFAGNIPEGGYARFMKANFDRLIGSAMDAATASYEAIGSVQPDLAILISCVGRKIVLKQRIEEEVENVREVLGKNTALTGFYSYGEISPFAHGAKCELHNQTMTVTTVVER
jgi:hypothetical protein